MRYDDFSEERENVDASDSKEPRSPEHPNLLPGDGEVYYFRNFLSEVESTAYFQRFLHNVDWKHDEVRMFGKKWVTGRKMAWYGDDSLRYTYSGKTREAIPWSQDLLRLKAKAEQYLGKQFNSCLLNLYHFGEEGMSWHADDEKELGVNPVIASVSLGAERKFVLKHRRTKEKVQVWLEAGSLLLMKGATQDNWLHSLPKTKKSQGERINLTFRKIITSKK